MPSEQLTEEELQNMPPEKLRELQKKQCIFCQIIAGKVASRKVYEDDKCIAVLDINPANPGHVLLLPKEHYSIMPQMEDDIIRYMFMVTKHISHALLRALKVEGTYIFVANGVAAGQRAAHFMIHIIPRKEGDGLPLEIPEHGLKEQELKQLKEMLIPKINERLYGFVPEAAEEKLEEKPVISPKIKQKVVEAEFEEEEKADLDAISALVTTHGVKESKKRKSLDEEKKDVYISSKSSQKFHTTNCPFAKNINKKNRVYFRTREDAEDAEKNPCRCVSD